jgi:hypothetical protein
MVVYDARPSAFTQLTTTGEWENFFSAVGIVSGIDFTTGSAMAPSLDTPGRNAVIADGNALIKGQLWRCDAPASTPIPAASAQNRIDRLVLRLTRGATTSPTVVQPVVITGTPSGSPVEPPLVQTPTGIWDLPISSWISTSAGGLTTLNDERQFSGNNPLVAYNTADQPVTSNIGKVNDTQLVLPVVANAVYKFWMYLNYEGGAGGSSDIAWQFATPAQAFLRYFAPYQGSGGTANVGNTNTGVTTPTARTQGAGVLCGTVLNGTLLMGANSGSFQFQWGQVTSSATATIVHAQSLMTLDRII